MNYANGLLNEAIGHPKYVDLLANIYRDIHEASSSGEELIFIEEHLPEIIVYHLQRQGFFVAGRVTFADEVSVWYTGVSVIPLEMVEKKARLFEALLCERYKEENLYI